MTPSPLPKGTSSGRRSLRIVTQNCYGLPFTYRHPRFEAIARRLEGLNADLVFLQEVIFAGDERKFSLPGYDCAWSPGNAINRGGLLTLSRSPIESCRFHPFRKQGDLRTMQWSDRLLGKGWLECSIPEWDLLAVNVHLVSTYKERVFTHDKVQESQLVQLLGHLKRPTRVVLGGDFNFMSGTPYHGQLTSNLEDISQGLPASGAVGCQPKIDHILVKGLGWTDAACQMITPKTLVGPKGPLPWSDHAMIRVDLSLDRHEVPGYPGNEPASAPIPAPWDSLKARVSAASR